MSDIKCKRLIIKQGNKEAVYDSFLNDTAIPMILSQGNIGSLFTIGNSNFGDNMNLLLAVQDLSDDITITVETYNGKTLNLVNMVTKAIMLDYDFSKPLIYLGDKPLKYIADIKKLEVMTI